MPIGTDTVPVPLLPVMHPSGHPVTPPSWLCHWSSWVTFRLEQLRDKRYQWAIWSFPPASATPVTHGPGTHGVASGVAATRDLALLDLEQRARRIPGVNHDLVLVVADHTGDQTASPLPLRPPLDATRGPWPADPQAPKRPTRYVSRLFGQPLKDLATMADRDRASGIDFTPSPDYLAPTYSDPEGRADPSDPVDLAGVHDVLTSLDTHLQAQPPGLGYAQGDWFPVGHLELVPSREAAVRARSEAAALRDIRPAIVVLATMTDPEDDPVRHATYHRELDRIDARLAEIADGIAQRLAWLERRVL